jgi:hypothetical protein
MRSTASVAGRCSISQHDDLPPLQGFRLLLYRIPASGAGRAISGAKAEWARSAEAVLRPSQDIDCGDPQEGIVKLSGRGMLIVSVAWQLGTGNFFARLLCCPAQAEGALGPLS